MASKKKRGAGGPMGMLGNGIWLIIVAGAVLGFVRVNDLTSVDKVYDYFRSWSDSADECIGDDPVENQLEACRGDGSTDDTPDAPVIIPPGSGGGLEDSPTPINDEKPKLLTILDKIPVNSNPDSEEESVADYNRSEWKHWSDFDKDGCDAREEILKAQGADVKIDTYCKAISGTWTDPYSGLEITDPSTIDIDHVLPLGWVAKHGGQDWSVDKKEKYANDPSILLISSATENRRKSDSGPSEYMPPKKEFQCAYSALWIKGLNKYELSIEAEDKKALAAGIESCK